jgi:hypothetical protein
MRSQVILGFTAGTIVILSLAGCWKKSGLAVVFDKEHIAAREIISIPTAQESVSPSTLTPGSGQLAPQEKKEPRELGKDEIVVDTYIMKADARGTSRDPRATNDEQWLVKVQMLADLRLFDVHTDQAHWRKVKIGDRIKVSYRQGKYTGTVWAAEIE